MQGAVRLQTTVLPGHRIEVSAPELPEGQAVEVIVLVPGHNGPHVKPRTTMADFLESLPKGPSPRLFETWEEYERFLREEKESWDR